MRTCLLTQIVFILLAMAVDNDIKRSLDNERRRRNYQKNKRLKLMKEQASIEAKAIAEQKRVVEEECIQRIANCKKAARYRRSQAAQATAALYVHSPRAIVYG